MKFIDKLSDKFLLNPASGSINIALIGIGGWGGVNAKSIMRSRKFRIVGIYDVDNKKAENFAVKQGVSAFRKIEDIFSDSSICAVCISVPNKYHYKIAISAALNDKNVFVEKPLTSTYSEGKELVEVCRARSLVLQSGCYLRHSDLFRKIKAIFEKKTYGDILFIYAANFVDTKPRHSWQLDPSENPIGSVEQLGVHMIDIVLFLLGNHCEVKGRVKRLRVGKGGDLGHVSMNYPEGVKAEIITGYSSIRIFEMKFIFEKASVFINGNCLEIIDNKKRKIKVKSSETEAQTEQFRIFADKIDGKIKDSSDIKDTLFSVKILEDLKNAQSE